MSSCTSKDYERMDRLAISIYKDYSLNQFPIDIYKLCNKMGIRLYKYSSFDGDNLELLKKKSNDGFYIPTTSGAAIFYNDINPCEERIRVTIGHEIKHFVCNDTGEDDKEEKLADHFARFLLCPTPYLIYFKIFDIFNIMSVFQISYQAARCAHNALLGRQNYYKDKIFDYEKPLIKMFI